MKKSLSLALALCMMVSATVIPAYAAEDVTEISTAGNPTAVPVVLQVEEAVFSVTVPTSLPVHIGSDGAVTTPENGANIMNNSAAPVAVQNVNVTAAPGWTLIDYSTNPTTFKINEKKLGLELNNVATGENGVWTFSATDWPVIAKDGSYNFKWKAILPPQTKDANGATMANVVFTIGWAE